LKSVRNSENIFQDNQFQCYKYFNGTAGRAGDLNKAKTKA